jgi:hypothetical protein
MIFRTVLIAGLLIIMVYAIFQRYRSPVVATGVLAASVFGIVFSISPELANKVAHGVGIGRGADLVLYCFILIMLAAILNLHLKLRSQHESLTEVVRAHAMAHPRLPTPAGGGSSHGGG